MRESVSISLPAEIRKKLDKLSKEVDINRSDIVREALQRYFFRYELEKIRKIMVPKARAQGIYTDEDVFRIVS